MFYKFTTGNVINLNYVTYIRKLKEYKYKISLLNSEGLFGYYIFIEGEEECNNFFEALGKIL